ncbi:class I tRNA ligase family protein [Aureisphaera galaxeae]|uniref:leucine--tRNA ligase n=1 Tax=Aureisphaera galaxeae TaxID=1538023 RepID=UPI00234FE76C|nr:class I tRNA ligase family protein [Aureisphaera galaxeae]MDC8002776.1 class I tRNA ligase family protein [Aureisphaera galaxeae]
MSKYHFNEIEAKWQKYWAENGTFHAQNDSDKPKYYVLDMFPYPSGAGLHVGHPLGYIASDVYARFKRHQGYNVLHPMGYDSFGLPAEQYAIQTGQHPADTTRVNIEGGVDKKGNKIAGYRNQLDKIGFSFDWSREVRTSNPDYYKWTQWIFIQLFESWYDNASDKARSIEALISIFAEEGNEHVDASCDDDTPSFTAEEWNGYADAEQQKILLKYRLTYLAETEVNWCPELGTVLANDEITNGVSERGGHPVIRKKMMQWSMRITAYAQRLLDDLAKIDWPQPLKDSQTNWIGRSEGASVTFKVMPNVTSSAVEKGHTIEVFTTRPDTIFGASFMTLAPEHDLVAKITTPEQKAEVEAYVEATAKRSERDRMADVKTISGVFTGAYAEHPFTGNPVPIWIGDYVLAGYGTGAVMAVPCGDQRDYDFAKHFGIEIPNIFEGIDISEEAFADKENTIIANSDFINGLNYKDATRKVIDALEAKGQGKGKINYRLRDAVFSRQRYWGEPFPVYYKNGLPQMIDLEHLPLELPAVEKYLPTETGEAPLGRASVWAWDTNLNKVVSNDLVSPSGVEGSESDNGVYPLELNTMPGWAGSSCYMFRYMDPKNPEMLASEDALKYWGNVDLYIGGSEHATSHLLYSRFWVKFLYDRAVLPVDEPAKKLINQGMILGESAFVHRALPILLSPQKGIKELNFLPFQIFASEDLILNGTFREERNTKHAEAASLVWDWMLENGYEHAEGDAIEFNFQAIHADVSYVNTSNELDREGFMGWRPEFQNAKFINTDDGAFKVSREVEKMSKSKYNVVNPDEICFQYGADTLRMYEMFLGPLDQAKPWSTAGITGVHSFLKKLWKLYHGGAEGAFQVSDATPTKDNLKTLHKTIKKVEEDIENFSFNTSVSTFMIAVNELTQQNCNSREILEPLLVLISPYAPHIAEELWNKLGHTQSIATAAFPKYDASHLVESSKEYPISFNGKMRFKLELPLDMSKEDIEAAVMAHERTQQQLDGRTPKKVIVVPGKIVNIVG